MRIVFLGINAIGRKVHDWLVDEGEDIVALWTKKKDLAELAEIAPDLVISGGFRHIVPEKYLGIPARGCINMHKSLLPFNRGANPNFWAIYEQTPAGVSIHFMDAGIDTGALLAQREVAVNPDDTSYTLYERLEEAQLELFREFWPKFKAGEAAPVEQRTLGRGSFHRIADFKAMRQLDPDAERNVGELIRLMRAMTYPPFDNLVFEEGGRRYAVEVVVRSVDGERDDRTDSVGVLKQYGE